MTYSPLRVGVPQFTVSVFFIIFCPLRYLEVCSSVTRRLSVLFVFCLADSHGEEEASPPRV